MTHAELVTVAVRWLKTRQRERCYVVLAEPPAQTGESPDAIGWNSRASYLVECKVSRADFLADLKKPRRVAGRRLARYCYYLAQAGLLGPEDVPAAWGLLELRGDAVHVVRDAEDGIHLRSGHEVRDEVNLLYAELRRYHAQGITYQTVGRIERGRRVGQRPAQAHLLDAPPVLQSQQETT